MGQMTMRIRLTDLAIRNKHKPRATRYEIPDGGQRGLYLIVQPSGVKSFAVRYRFNGIARKLTLKSGLSLADARKAAADAMYAIEKGTDPREAKIEARAKTANTLQYVCERYLKREGDKLRSIRDRESALRRLVFPVLGHRQIDLIKRTEISQMLDAIEDRNGSRAADLVLSYLRKILNWYSIQSDTFSSPIVVGMGRYDIADNRRTRFLNDDEIRKLWKATEVDRPAAACLRFLLLTGARKQEAAGLRWEEITGQEWLLPAARHKNKKVDLLRPLSAAALAIVHAQPQVGEYVFSTIGTAPIDLDGNAARNFKKRIGISSWRIHDLRRTSRTLLSRAKIDSDIAEKCLGHLPSGLRQTYDQHRYQHEMHHAYEALSALIERIVNPPETSVIPLRR
jgi:integrase